MFKNSHSINEYSEILRPKIITVWQSTCWSAVTTTGSL